MAAAGLHRTRVLYAARSLTTEETVHVIVLRRRDAGESDRRLTLLTQESGVMDVVAKGARKAASRLAGCSEPLSACIMHLAKGKALRYVTQAQPITSFPGLRADYDRLTCALALTELASAVLPHGNPAEEEFLFLLQALRYLEVHEHPLVALIWAQTRLMQLAGLMPEFEACAVSGGAVAESRPWVSPIAGGYIAEAIAGRYGDRFRVSAEDLYGARAIVGLDVPPPRLKRASSIFAMLLRFWQAYAEDPLPTNRGVGEGFRVEG